MDGIQINRTSADFSLAASGSGSGTLPPTEGGLPHFEPPKKSSARSQRMHFGASKQLTRLRHSTFLCFLSGFESPTTIPKSQ